MITLKQLEALCWRAKLQSFASAANRLHTSPSAVSKRVSELERAIGEPLFDRGRRMPRLTARGERITAGAERLLALRDEVLATAGKAPLGAAQALGLRYGQAMRHVILPQALRNMTPLLLTQGIVLFQDTSLVYVSALTDFFDEACGLGERDGRVVEMLLFAGAVYFVICYSFSLLVKRYRRVAVY